MTSASTLARRARAEKNPKKAKALRAEAAKLRREEREATRSHIEAAQAVADGWKKRPSKAASKIINGLQQALEVAQSDNAAPHWRQLQQVAEQPGRGEIVGGKMAQKAEVIAKMARHKGGVDAIQQMLTNLESQARYEANREAEERFGKERIQVHQNMRDKIVCGFIASVEAHQRLQRGLKPDQVIHLNALTVVNIVDALNAAGYHADGKR